MRRTAFLLPFALAALVACSDDDPTGVPRYKYTLTVPGSNIGVGQDSTVALDVQVNREGSDTTLKNVVLLYQSLNNAIATVDGNGVVTGVSGGTATINVSGVGTSIDVPVTVRAHPATSIELTVLSGPAGGRLTTNFDTGTFYALPADRNTSRLKAVVKVGNDTVFCNYCVGTRVQRLVRFRSLDEALATVSNATNPTVAASIDTSGRVTAFDTSSSGVRIVLEVPADNKADTVLLKLALRPIDTLRIRPDSAFFPVANGTGTSKQIYPNSDTLQANVVQASTTNFVAGITYLSRVQDLPAANSNTNPNARWIEVRPIGSVFFVRSNLPAVTWESANPQYVSINAAGAVVGLCAFIGGSCPTQQAAVLNCNSNSGTMPAAFNGPGTYSIPNCVGKQPITMPGAFCASTSSSDLSSTCSVWIRATATDQATGKQLRRLYRINVRR